MNENIEAIILAGGQGTRLRGVIGEDLPKPMADINGVPFLEILLRKCIRDGISRVIISVGYKKEKIIEYFGDNFLGLEIFYCIENTPLGTGGAIAKALKMCQNKCVLVFNGDSFLNINLKTFFTKANLLAKVNYSYLVFALTNLINTRYGAIELDRQNYIAKFLNTPQEYSQQKSLINSGIYFIHKEIFSTFSMPEYFSFENFLQTHFKDIKACGIAYEADFIDIGIPDDYKKAQSFFKTT